MISENDFNSYSKPSFCQNYSIEEEKKESIFIENQNFEKNKNCKKGEKDYSIDFGLTSLDNSVYREKSSTQNLQNFSSEIRDTRVLYNKSNMSSSFRKNNTKKFLLNHSEALEIFYEDYFKFYFLRDEEIVNYDENSTTNINITFSNKELERTKYIDKIYKDYKFIDMNDENEFYTEYKIFLSLLKTAFSYITEKDIIHILHKFIKKKTIFFEFINAMYLFDKINLYCQYYDYLLSSRQFKSRDYSVENLNNFYNDPLNFDFSEVLKNFKTIYLEDYFDEYTDLSNVAESRRELKLDRKLNFNYVCMECPFHYINNNYHFTKPNYEEFKICFFSHNKTESCYHPFIYKTMMCPKVKENVNECNDEDCYFSHDYMDDFRLLPSFKNEEINKVLIYCIQNELFGFKKTTEIYEVIKKLKKITLENEEDTKLVKDLINKALSLKNEQISYDLLPSEFNPYTYKINKCPFGNYCKLDSIFCLNYHDYTERRRDPQKFKYRGKKCNEIYDKDSKDAKDKKNWKNPKFCKNGDDCISSHNLYEYLYSEEHYKKKNCQKEKINKICDYLIICPYKHEEDYDEYGYESCVFLHYNNKILRNIKLLENDIFELEKVKIMHSCSTCNEILKKEYFYLNPCNHIICPKCNDKKETCLKCNKIIIDRCWIELKKN